MPKETKPQSHQVAAVKQLKKSRSLLLNHSLGSGKTYTAIMSGEDTPGAKLVLTPASLQHNFKKELHKFNIPDKDYHLVSYEKFRKNPESIVDKLKPSLIIADEFHRTQNQDSLLGSKLREIRKKSGARFLGLTGTVAQNHPSEIADLLYNASGYPVLGNKEQFKKHFINERKVYPGLIGRLMGRKPGIVEEPKHLDQFKSITDRYINTFAGDKEYKKHIPIVERETVRVPMDKPQQKIYDYTFGKSPYWVRYKIKHNLPLNKQESTNINSFLMGARQASTSLNPFGDKTQTPKMKAVLHDLEYGIKHDPNFKGVVYSNFLEGGINPLSEALKKKKISFGTFTGEQTHKERNQMVHDYNKGKLKTLLLSQAGGEGLDLKGTKFMGILDPNWNPSKTNQIIGRGARFKSHEHLPIEERKLKVKEYLAEPSLGIFGKIKKIFRPDTHAIGTDEYIQSRSKEKEVLNKKFTDILMHKKVLTNV